MTKFNSLAKYMHSVTAGDDVNYVFPLLFRKLSNECVRNLTVNLVYNAVKQ